MVRRCTYPSIHLFVSRSRSVVDCALCGVVWYVWCEGGCVYVWCVVWSGVVLCGVVRLGMRKTPPCVRSRRIRVYRENARSRRPHSRVCRSGGVLPLFPKGLPA